MFYSSVIRSVIDYAAPIIVQFIAVQLLSLGLIQNETICIILGCSKTVKMEVLKAELNLPIIVNRISEITCPTSSRCFKLLIILELDSQTPLFPIIMYKYP